MIIKVAGFRRAPPPYAIMLVAVGDKPNFNKFLKVNDYLVSRLMYSLYAIHFDSIDHGFCQSGLYSRAIYLVELADEKGRGR